MKVKSMAPDEILPDGLIVVVCFVDNRPAWVADSFFDAERATLRAKELSTALGDYRAIKVKGGRYD